MPERKMMDLLQAQFLTTPKTSLLRYSTPLKQCPTPTNGSPSPFEISHAAIVTEEIPANSWIGAQTGVVSPIMWRISGVDLLLIHTISGKITRWTSQEHLKLVDLVHSSESTAVVLWGTSQHIGGFEIDTRCMECVLSFASIVVPPWFTILRTSISRWLLVTLGGELEYISLKYDVMPLVACSASSGSLSYQLWSKISPFRKKRTLDLAAFDPWRNQAVLVWREGILEIWDCAPSSEKPVLTLTTDLQKVISPAEILSIHCGEPDDRFTLMVIDKALSRHFVAVSSFPPRKVELLFSLKTKCDFYWQPGEVLSNYHSGVTLFSFKKAQRMVLLTPGFLVSDDSNCELVDLTSEDRCLGVTDVAIESSSILVICDQQILRIRALSISERLRSCIPDFKDAFLKSCGKLRTAFAIAELLYTHVQLSCTAQSALRSLFSESSLPHCDHQSGRITISPLAHCAVQRLKTLLNPLFQDDTGSRTLGQVFHVAQEIWEPLNSFLDHFWALFRAGGWLDTQNRSKNFPLWDEDSEVISWKGSADIIEAVQDQALFMSSLDVTLNRVRDLLQLFIAPELENSSIVLPLSLTNCIFRSQNFDADIASLSLLIGAVNPSALRGPLSITASIKEILMHAENDGNKALESACQCAELLLRSGIAKSVAELLESKSISHPHLRLLCSALSRTPHNTGPMKQILQDLSELDGDRELFLSALATLWTRLPSSDNTHFQIFQWLTSADSSDQRIFLHADGMMLCETSLLRQFISTLPRPNYFVARYLQATGDTDDAAYQFASLAFTPDPLPLWFRADCCEHACACMKNNAVVNDYVIHAHIQLKILAMCTSASHDPQLSPPQKQELSERLSQLNSSFVDISSLFELSRQLREWGGALIELQILSKSPHSVESHIFEAIEYAVSYLSRTNDFVQSCGIVVKNYALSFSSPFPLHYVLALIEAHLQQTHLESTQLEKTKIVLEAMQQAGMSGDDLFDSYRMLSDSAMLLAYKSLSDVGVLLRMSLLFHQCCLTIKSVEKAKLLFASVDARAKKMIADQRSGQRLLSQEDMLKLKSIMSTLCEAEVMISQQLVYVREPSFLLA